MEEEVGIEEMQELRTFFEEQDLLNLNRHMTDYLMKVGVKLRRYKWKEFEAA